MGDWLERNRGFIVVTLINVAFAGGLFFWLQRPAPPPIEIVPPDPTYSPAPTLTSTPSPLRVYVTGAVLQADVYWLMPGSIVKDAIQAAGGATDDADLSRINLAQELHDQEQIYVPRLGESDAPPPVTGAQPTPLLRGGAPTGAVNINTASLEELDTLPGIGPVIGQSIIDYREANGPFRSIDEITLVSGIADVTFDKIKDHITVGD
jgi:competence protein ComEA